MEREIWKVLITAAGIWAVWTMTQGIGQYAQVRSGLEEQSKEVSAKGQNTINNDHMREDQAPESRIFTGNDTQRQ